MKWKQAAGDYLIAERETLEREKEGKRGVRRENRTNEEQAQKGMQRSFYHKKSAATWLVNKIHK